MPHTILVPLDGTPSSEAAIAFALALAERTHSKLTLFHATGAAPTLGNVSERQEHATEDSGRYLSAIAERIRADGLPVETVVGYGSPAQSITNEISARNVDLVAMATHDPTGRQRWAHGSVVESVIGHIAIPVLVVSASSGVPVADRFRDQQPVLIVPLDGSEVAEAALPVAADLAERLNGQLVLVGVVSPIGQQDPVRRGSPASLAEQDFHQVQQEARTYLAGIARRLEPHVEVATEVLTGAAGREINRRSEERGAAAIVMATHGRTGVFRTLLGSVAGQVVHSGSTPVFLVHPIEAHPTGGSQSRRIGWGVQLDDTRRRQ